MPKTNILQYYIDAFGEITIIEAIRKAQLEMNSRSRKAESKITPVNNPVIRFMIATVDIKGKKLTQNIQKTLLSEDQYVYFNITGACLRLIKDEVKNSPYYINELKRGLLGTDAGSALADLNELISAAYYKWLGEKISFPSGAGMPDVDILNKPYATDAKLFPNGQLQLMAALNESRVLIPKIFSGQAPGNTIVSIFTPDKKKIHEAFNALLKHISTSPNEYFKSPYINILDIPNDYKAGDLTIAFYPENYKVHFQATWPRDDAVKLMKKSIEKSIVQVQRLHKDAITWVMVPDDAKKHSIQTMALRVGTDIGGFIEKQEHLRQVVVYSISPYRNGNKLGAQYGVDVYGRATKDIDISKAKINSFFKTIISQPELVIP